jgi:hypothetical protein
MSPLINNPVELLVKLSHRFPLLDPYRFKLLVQALIGSFLIQLASFQACNIVLYGVVCGNAGCEEASYRDNAAKG